MKIASKLGLTAAAGALALTLGACSGPSLLTEDAAVTMQGMAAGIASNQMGFLSDPTVYLDGVTTIASARTGLVSPQQVSCTVTYTGQLDGLDTPIDGDGDDIPADVTATHVCEGEGGGTTSGSVTLRDRSDEIPADGFTLTFNDYVWSIPLGEESISLGFDGSFTATANTDNYTARMDLEVWLDLAGERFSTTYNFDQTYVPDDMADPFAAGTFDFDGAFSFAAGGEFYSLTTEGTGVHWNGTSVDNGIITLTDSAGNSLVVDIIGVDSWTATYNGADITDPNAPAF